MDSNQALEVKNIITGLLISTPLRMTINHLLKDYRDIEGRNIPFRELGFVSIEDYLQSIPDTVNIYGSGPFAEIEAVVTSKCEHINTMVLKQKKSKVPPRKRTYTKNFHPVRMKPPSWNYYSPKTPLTNYQMKIPINNRIQESVACKNEYEVKSSSMFHVSSKVDFQSEETIQASKLTLELKNESDMQAQNSLSDSFLKEISSVKSQNDESYCLETNSQSRDITQNTELVFNNDDDSHSSIEANYEVPDIQELDILELSKDLEPFSKGFAETHENVFSIEEDYACRIPDRVQGNLKTLMQHFPGGIECTKLPGEYKKMFKRTLCYEDYSYRSLIQMCTDLPEIFHYIQQTSHEYMLFDKTKPIPILDQDISLNICVQKETMSKTHILEELPKLNKSTRSALIPSDVISTSVQISRLFPSDVVVGDLLEISIGEIYDLSKFWIYMTFGDLDQLMKDLQDFFWTNHKRYQIPEVLVEEGLYCVALYSGQYHRCVIVNLLHKIPGCVRVFFIDYGTVNNVRIEEVWFLPQQFAELPAQAIRARLSNIYPVYENRPWCAEAVARFEQLISRSVIVAEVTRVDEQDHVLEIYLADITNKDNIFYINDVFVQEGYALYTDQERKKTHLVDHDCIPNVRYIHLYPEFYEIEAGLAPTTDEMIYINENKIPLHYLMPQYFDIHFYEDINGIQLQHEKFNQRRLTEITIDLPEKSEFDLDCFPDSLKDEIRELYELDNPDKTKKSKSEISVKTELYCGDKSETNTSVKEYFCNKKRLSELRNGKNIKTDTCESKAYCDKADLFSFKSNDSSSSSLDQIEDIVPLNNSLQKLSLSSSDLCSRPTSRASTNPFLNGSFGTSGMNSNPFRSTNPFLNDLEETVNNSDLLNLFAKSSEEALPQKIVNNLKDSHPCKGKMNKQIKVDNCPIRNYAETSNLVSGETTNISNSAPSSTSMTNTPRRIRTPPGFSSTPLQNRLPTESNFNNMLNYVPNNFSNTSYYSGLPLSQFNNNGYLTQNQLYLSYGQPFMNGYFNSIPQFYPNQYNFNPNWQQLFSPPSGYGFPPSKDKKS